MKPCLVKFPLSDCLLLLKRSLEISIPDVLLAEWVLAIGLFSASRKIKGNVTVT